MPGTVGQRKCLKTSRAIIDNTKKAYTKRPLPPKPVCRCRVAGEAGLYNEALCAVFSQPAAPSSSDH